MVLKSNVENIAPSQLVNAKSLVSRVRISLTDPSRRHRARTNALNRKSDYKIRQAKRRNVVSSKSTDNAVKFTVNTIPSAPPVVDVEMRDAAPAVVSIPVLLPKELGRPEYTEISKEALAAIDPSLADANMVFLRDYLEDCGPEMLKVLSSVKANPVKESLPKELAVVVQDLSHAMPSHMMAVYGPPPKQGSNERRKVTLYPVHSLVLAAYCSKLPPFPLASYPPSALPNEATLPVRPMCLPSPQTYPRLSSFLYTKRSDVLLQSLLPTPAPFTVQQMQPATIDADSSDPSSSSSSPSPSLPTMDAQQQQQQQLVAFATKLATTYTTQAMLQHTVTVHGLWQNVCALGIFDDGLWDTIDLAWKILLTAIAIGTGNRQSMIQPAQTQTKSRAKSQSPQLQRQPPQQASREATPAS